ncbi:hypothetical protein TNCV_2021591 [Trichonephila clavipes]|nr:hypothetical protein TNCV_2021591 [Trichonephila clavipes]
MGDLKANTNGLRLKPMGEVPNKIKCGQGRPEQEKVQISKCLMPSTKINRRPESLSSVNLNSSVKSTEVHCCLFQETCSLAQGVIARGRPGTYLLGMFGLILIPETVDHETHYLRMGH